MVIIFKGTLAKKCCRLPRIPQFLYDLFYICGVMPSAQLFGRLYFKYKE